MNEKENGFFKGLRYFLLTCVISFGFISIVATGSGSWGTFEYGWYPKPDSPTPPDLGTAPMITLVYVYDSNWVETDSFDIGEYNNFRVYASDPDKDMRRIYITEYYPDDSTTPYHGPVSETLPCVSTVDTYYYRNEPYEVTGPSGTWRVEFQIEDSKGNESNIWKAYYIVN